MIAWCLGVSERVWRKFRKRKKAKKRMAAIGVGVAQKTELKDWTDKTAKWLKKKVSQHRQTERHTEWEITKAYEFICVVSVKPMCYSPKFSKPHIYQGSIVGRSFSFELLIRYDHSESVCSCICTYCKSLFNYTMSYTLFWAVHAILPCKRYRTTKTTNEQQNEWIRLEMATLERNITDPQSGKLRCCRYRFVQLYAPS